MSDTTSSPANDRRDLNAFVQQAYTHLKRLAAYHLRRERASHTLQPTALVNEVYRKLHAHTRVQWKSVGHFKAIAALQMRRILIDHARKCKRAPNAREALRPGEAGAPAPQEVPRADILALEEALKELEAADPQAGMIAVFRYYGGMTHAEIGDRLGMSTRTVERKWAVARRWLEVRLGPSEDA